MVSFFWRRRPHLSTTVEPTCMHGPRSKRGRLVRCATLSRDKQIDKRQANRWLDILGTFSFLRIGCMLISILRTPLEEVSRFRN
jgi:hypothetical protein